MEFIAHRVNTVAELNSVPAEYGCEIDLRTWGNDIILAHDPFILGEKFEDWLKHYKNQTLILNIKTERIEHQVLDLIKKYNVNKYFFLDSSFPMINLLSKEGCSKLALRFSEYEGMDTLRSMQGKVEWVWVDCFNRIPLDKKMYSEIKMMGFKTCFVSPELQGRSQDISTYKSQLTAEGILFDAICTKIYNIPAWN